MSSLQIISETPLSLSQVKEQIEKIQKRDKELGFRTLRTEEYLQHFVHKNSGKLLESLKKLEIARLKDEHLIKVVDLMPKTLEDLKSILSGYTVTVTKENMAKIVEEVNKFLT